MVMLNEYVEYVELDISYVGRWNKIILVQIM